MAPERAAIYLGTDPEGHLPPAEEQRAALEAYARGKGYAVLAYYEDLDAPRVLLYHWPGLKQAINNIKEEGWELLLVADPRCISETETALHEFVHKFSLYNNRVESPQRGWEELLADTKAIPPGDGPAPMTCVFGPRAAVRGWAPRAKKESAMYLRRSGARERARQYDKPVGGRHT